MELLGRSYLFQIQHKQWQFWFGNQKVLDMIDYIGGDFVFFSPKTHIILRDWMSQSQITFFKKWM